MPQVETMTRDSNKGVGGNERSSSTQALVLYTFEASSSNEMSIIENQILTVIKSDDDWTLCKNPETSQLGYVPTQYIQIIVKPQIRPQLNVSRKVSNNQQSTTTTSTSINVSSNKQQERNNSDHETNQKPPLSARNKVSSTQVPTSSSSSNETITTTTPTINTKLADSQKSSSPQSPATSTSSTDNFTSVKQRIKFLQEHQLPIPGANNTTNQQDKSKRVQFVQTPRNQDSSPIPNTVNNNVNVNTTTNNNTVNNNTNNSGNGSGINQSSTIESGSSSGNVSGRPPKPKGYSTGTPSGNNNGNISGINSSGSTSGSSSLNVSTPPSGTSPVLNNYLQMYGAVPILPFVKPMQTKNLTPDETYENAVNNSISNNQYSTSGSSLNGSSVPTSTQDSNLLVDTRVEDKKGLAKLGRSLSRKFKKNHKNHHSAATPTSGDDDEIIQSSTTGHTDYLKTSPRATTSFQQSPITSLTNENEFDKPALPPKKTRGIEEELDAADKRKTLPVNMRNDLFQKMHSQLKMQSFTGDNAPSLSRTGSILQTTQAEDDVQFINEIRKPSMSKSVAVKLIADKMKFYNNYRLMKYYLQKDESLKNARIRKQKVLEIVSTERDYVQNIHICVDEFLAPMRTNPKKFGVKNEQLDVLFLNILQILQCNQELLKRLNEQVNENQQGRTTCVRIGIVFREMAVWFKLYTDYINNHESATSTYDSLIERKKKFAAYIEKQQNNPKCKNLPLAAYLIQPVQRIPRYRLLLADVIKLTPTDHVDFDDLQKGYQAILEIADWVNERKRENENQHSLTKLQLKLTDSEFKQIFLPHRKLISKTETLKSTITFKDHESDFDKYFAFNRQTEAYLFSDMLIIALGEQVDTSQALSQQHIIMRENLVIIYFVFVKIVKVEYMQPVEDAPAQTDSVPNMVQIAYGLRGKDLMFEFNLESCDNHFSKKILSCINTCKKNVSNKTGMDPESLFGVSAQFNRILRSIPEIKDQMKRKKEKATRMQAEITTISKEIERKEQEVLRLLEEINNLKEQKMQNELGISEAEQDSVKSSSDFKQVAEEKKKCQENVFTILGNDLFAYTEMFGSISNRDDPKILMD
ncbi:rhoGEF domain-containing protein [Naegleria gruberi]|uniref:RhoGEF domain-containing protein n=1 Tax=Naegleria gruberi TaxID=5762 RepID=D2VFQ4_NAEGR|nr:rhoGEF domain-containing protein [Naegleria gruberi]EFC44398.1 rhoGEF domain-containing protein [Naegleria gruberi]|eukprot:XP_002677142.1 rhoGEF domain-containing protein [Naegleria gruberi strain NEG-M]